MRRLITTFSVIALLACAPLYARTKVQFDVTDGAVTTLGVLMLPVKSLKACPGATVEMLVSGTPQTLYNSAGTSLGTSVNSGTAARVAFYIDDGTYDVRITGGGCSTHTWTGFNVGSSGTTVIDVTASPYNATGDGVTDDTAAFEAVLDYVNANGSIGSSKQTTRFVINIPDGVYWIPAGLTNSIDVANVWWVGASPDGTIIKGQSGTLFKWGGAGNVYGGGMRDIKFFYGSAGAGDAADTTALCLDFYDATHLSFEGIRLRDVGKFAKLGDAAAAKSAFSIRFRDIMGHTANIGVPTFDLQLGAGFYLSDSIINVNGVDVPVGTDAHEALAGQTFLNAQGSWDTVQMADVLINRYYYNIYVKSNSGKVNSNWFFNGFIGDYSARGVLLDSNGGHIRNHKYTNCWSVATDEDSWKLMGLNGSGFLESIDFVSCLAIISGRHGWNIEKGNKISLDSSCESIGQGRLTTGYGVYLNGAPVQNITIIGGRHGLDGAPYTSYSPLQATYGIKVETTALRYTITDVRASGITDPFSFVNPSAQAGSCLIRNNRKIDGAKPTYATITAATVPASTVAFTNSSPFVKHYYIRGGTVTEVKKGSTVVATDTDVFVELRPQETWTITYTVVPTVIEDIVP